MNETQFELKFRFDELTPAKANIAARELEKEIRRLTGGQVQTELRRVCEEAQDIGSIVSIILGTPEAIAFATPIAMGVGALIARWRSEVTIVTERGQIIFKGQATNDTDLVAIADAMCRKMPTKEDDEDDD